MIIQKISHQKFLFVDEKLTILVVRNRTDSGGIKREII